MRARYVFAAGRVDVRDVPDVYTGVTSVTVRLVEVSGHGRDATLHRTADWYNGALVFREAGAP